MWGENNIIRINLSLSNSKYFIELIFPADDASLAKKKKRNEKQAKKQTKQNNRQVIW